MLYHARKLRSLVSIDVEYAARRALCSVLPMANTDVGALFHCCVHKTASQWVRLIISDPRFCRAVGLKPYFAPAMRLNFPDERKPVPEHSIVGSFFTDKDTLLEIDKPANWRAFFVTRDPRDLLISRYHSARYSHRESPEIIETRAQMSGMDEEEGIKYILDNRFEDIISRLQSFANFSEQDAQIVQVKYEDLTGPNRLETWTSLMARLNLPIPERTLNTLLEFYRFDRMRAPSAAGKHDEKYRHGQKGEWHERLTEPVKNAFERRCGNLPAMLGYD